jgi:hypothetical protein
MATKLLDDLATRQQQHEGEYRELVARLAAGEDVADAGGTETLLHRAGKTTADLTRDVAAAKRLTELHRRVEVGKAADTRFGEVSQRIADVDAERRRELERINSEFALKQAPLQSQLAEAVRLSQEGHTAAVELARMASHRPPRNNHDAPRMPAVRAPMNPADSWIEMK